MFGLSIKHDGTEVDIDHKTLYVDGSEKYKPIEQKQRFRIEVIV